VRSIDSEGLSDGSYAKSFSLDLENPEIKIYLDTDSRYTFSLASQISTFIPESFDMESPASRTNTLSVNAYISGGQTINFVLSRVQISSSYLNLSPGETANLTASASTSKGSSLVEWESSNSEVATVSSTGLITAVQTGVSLISAKASDDPSGFRGLTIIEVSEEQSGSYTISFDANGASGTLKSQSSDTGSTVSLAANSFTYSNYGFAGWNTEADASGYWFSDEASFNYPYTSNLTLYAQWAPDIDSGAYIAGDGSGGGGAGDYTTDYSETADGGAGAGSDSTILGSLYNDVIFGDGSGGGGGGEPYRASPGGSGGSGNDVIYGYEGDDIIFGDGFNGDSGTSDGSTVVDTNGAAGGFGGGGGGGGAYYTSDYGDGGNGGLLAGGGGGQSSSSPGSSLFGGYSGGSDSMPANGSSSAVVNRWGGNAASPESFSSYNSTQALGGTGYNSYGAGGGAGFGGNNAQSQSIDSGVTQNSNGGQPQGGAGSDGTAGLVMYLDTTEELYNLVYEYLSSIYDTAPGTSSGTGSGNDIIDGGAGSDQLFGMGGDDIFQFTLDTVESGDTDTIWDFNLSDENDQIRIVEAGLIKDSSSLSSYIASQTTNGDDRSLSIECNNGNTLTVVVKNLGRDLNLSDFVTE